MKNQPIAIFLTIVVLCFISTFYANESKPWARIGWEGQNLTKFDKQIFKEVAECAASYCQHQQWVNRISFYSSMGSGILSGLVAAAYSINRSIRNKESTLITKLRLFGSVVCVYCFWALLYNALPRIIDRAKTVEFEQQQQSIIDNAKKALKLSLQTNDQPRPLLGNLCRTKQELAQNLGICPTLDRESIYERLRSKYKNSDIDQWPLILLMDSAIAGNRIFRTCGVHEHFFSDLSLQTWQTWVKNFMKTIARIEERPRKQRTWYQTFWKFTKKRVLFT